MKKNCEIIKDLLPLYIDNVCSNASKDLINEHLKSCNNCQKELENIKDNIVISKKNEINVFQNFIKKINLKIIRNSILITILIIALIIPILYFCNNYEFTMEYNEDIKLTLHTSNTKWNFQFNSSTCGTLYSEIKTIPENNELINYIFLTKKNTLQELSEYKKGYSCSIFPNINYEKINLNSQIKVYYTTDDLEKIKNASTEELKNIINNSTLIFDKELSTSTINCTLNGKDYNYSLTYYKVNKQITESIGDENMPKKLLMDIYSIYGDYKSLWYPGDTATEIFAKIKEYINSNGGSCNLINY